VTATEGVGATFTGSANGDLNGDGTLSTFSISGTLQRESGGGIELTIAPNIEESLPEE